MLQPISEPIVQDNRPCFILGLPSELQLRVFGMLSVKDILRCAETCRSFQNTISTSMELRYQIDSAAHCLRLLRVDDQSIHERYHLLQEKIRALNTLDFSRMESMTLGPYDNRRDKPRVSFVDGWLSVTYRRGNDAAQIIDCNTPSLSMRAWERETLGPMEDSLSLECTILDLWQDLLVCASVRVGLTIRGEPMCYLELRTISGGHEDTHPLAAHGTLVSAGFPCIGMIGIESVESKFEVNGDFVAMLKSDRGRRVGFFSLLQVWNWKEGRTTFTLREHDKEPYMHDFCFLDSGRLLVLTALGYIEVYSYADFDKPLHLQARFMLPVRMPKSTHLYTSPFPDSVYTQGNGLRGPTYVPTLEGRISVLATTNPGRLLVIWNDIFLPQVPPFCDIQQDEDGVYIIPWNIWGPTNTQAFTVCGPHKLLFSVSGSRLLLGRPSGGHSRSPTGEKHDLYMLDFNPARISTPLVCKDRDDESEEEGGEANVISLPNFTRTACASRVARKWFPGTTLPYRETVLMSLSDEPLLGVHMDENGIALVRCQLADHQDWQMQLVVEMFRT